ncbi:MAG TPA: ATP-binding protein [Gaiellaceae bacterium]|nr:ATP-binding protein [Gaiellaceae bacterium]
MPPRRAAADLRQVLPRRFPADPGRRRHGAGSVICRELVRRMEGRVSVSSREGEGSTFVVDLPLVPSSAREQAVVSQSA